MNVIATRSTTAARCAGAVVLAGTIWLTAIPARAAPEQRKRTGGAGGPSAQLSTEWLDEAVIPRFIARKLRPPSSLRNTPATSQRAQMRPGVFGSAISPVM